MQVKPLISIALVDDALPLRSLAGTYLSTQGFEIICEAATGEQLMEMLAQLPKLPDLCLLDANMPGMSGCGTAWILRKDYPTIRIMAYSFFDENDRPDKMLECGAHYFVSKEASPSALSAALHLLYKQSPKNTSAQGCCAADGEP